MNRARASAPPEQGLGCRLVTRRLARGARALPVFTPGVKGNYFAACSTPNVGPDAFGSGRRSRCHGTSADGRGPAPLLDLTAADGPRLNMRR